MLDAIGLPGQVEQQPANPLGRQAEEVADGRRPDLREGVIQPIGRFVGHVRGVDQGWGSLQPGEALAEDQGRELAKPFIGAIDQDHPGRIIALVHAVDELLKFGCLIITRGHLRRSRQRGESLYPLLR